MKLLKCEYVNDVLIIYKLTDLFSIRSVIIAWTIMSHFMCVISFVIIMTKFIDILLSIYITLTSKYPTRIDIPKFS